MGKYKIGQLVRHCNSINKIHSICSLGYYLSDNPACNFIREEKLQPLKLIDLLNLMAEGKIEKGTKVIDGQHLFYYGEEEFVFDESSLNDEVEVYAPWETKVEPVDFSDMDMESTKFESQKIKELDPELIAKGKNIEKAAVAMFDKLNEVIRKVNGD